MFQSCSRLKRVLLPQDLPDVEGDRQHDIQTFATQMGVRNIALLVRSLRRSGLLTHP